MNTHKRKALNAALTQTIENRSDNNQVEVTREEVEWNRDQMTIAMLQDEGFITDPLMRDTVLDAYIQWTKGELAFNPPRAFHRAVAGHVAALLAETADKRKNPDGVAIIEHMMYCLDAGHTSTEAIKITADELKIESIDKVARYWGRCVESRNYKKRKRPVSK